MQGSNKIRRLSVMGNLFTEAAMQKLKDAARLKEISLLSGVTLPRPCSMN